MKQEMGLRMSAMAVAITVLSGCAAIDTAQNVYSAAKTGYTAKAAYSDVKDIKDAQPAFAGYSAVVVYADLVPHDKDKAAAVSAAFTDSLAYQVQQFGTAVGAQLAVCRDAASCSGKSVAVQFREEAYNANLAEKLTMGSQLKGKLTYVDSATGRVISEKRIEGVNTYTDVLGLIRGSISVSMMRSYSTAVSEDAMNRVPAVKPGSEKLLSGS